jgi:hypothetical protein
MIMKKISLIVIFLLIPIFYAYSQDDKEINKRDVKPVKIIQKEIVCPDCQGFGWIYCPNSSLIKVKNNMVASAHYSNNSGTSDNFRVLKMICPYCGGRKTVLVEYLVF